MLRWFEHNQVYHPSRTMDATGAELGRPFEVLALRTSDGLNLQAWFYPALPDSPRRNWAILLCHGNAGNLSHRLDTISVLLESGASVFAFDYRGYGRSEGQPSEEGTYLDAQSALQSLRAKGFSGARVIGFGESLGGGVVSELALRETLAGIVLQSTFTSIPDIGSEIFPFLPVRWLASIRYNTRAKLPRLHIPVLVMHGRADEIIRFRHGERNFAAANEPKLFWELAGGHNDPLADRRLFLTGLDLFLQLLESNSAQSNQTTRRSDAQ